MTKPDDILAIADRLWREEVSIEEVHPFSMIGDAQEVADGVAFIPSFSNVTGLRTGDGLVLVDTGPKPLATHNHATMRRWDRSPLHTAVYSHGHIDHVFGLGPYDAEAAAAKQPAPRVLAHEAVPHRFDRYLLTAGYNEIVNQRQFQMPDLEWPRDYRYPDETYRVDATLSVGELDLVVSHHRGETDDHSVTWIPQRRVLCCGDLFIWASPNAGNPQKVQRYPAEWARALRGLADLGAELLLPGHGVPVVGRERIRQALTDSAELLQSLHDQTVDMMNAGARLNDIVHTVRAPQHLLERPYLRPVYDEPEFVVRNVWRLYGGWWDGDPASLKPAPARDLAIELAALAGGAERLADRAMHVIGGDPRLAGHLAELARQAAPEDPHIRAVHTEIYRRRAATEASTMARGVFSWAASQTATEEA